MDPLTQHQPVVACTEHTDSKGADSTPCAPQAQGLPSPLVSLLSLAPLIGATSLPEAALLSHGAKTINSFKLGDGTAHITISLSGRSTPTKVTVADEVDGSSPAADDIAAPATEPQQHATAALAACLTAAIGATCTAQAGESQQDHPCMSNPADVPPTPVAAAAPVAQQAAYPTDRPVPATEDLPARPAAAIPPPAGGPAHNAERSAAEAGSMPTPLAAVMLCTDMVAATADSVPAAVVANMPCSLSPDTCSFPQQAADLPVAAFEHAANNLTAPATGSAAKLAAAPAVLAAAGAAEAAVSTAALPATAAVPAQGMGPKRLKVKPFTSQGPTKATTKAKAPAKPKGPPKPRAPPKPKAPKPVTKPVTPAPPASATTSQPPKKRGRPSKQATAAKGVVRLASTQASAPAAITAGAAAGAWTYTMPPVASHHTEQMDLLQQMAQLRRQSMGTDYSAASTSTMAGLLAPLLSTGSGAYAGFASSAAPVGLQQLVSGIAAGAYPAATASGLPSYGATAFLQVPATQQRRRLSQQQSQQQQQEQGGFGPLPLLGAQPSDLMARTSLTGGFDYPTMAASYAVASGTHHANEYANTSSVRMVGGSYYGSDGYGEREVNTAVRGVEVAASYEEAFILHDLDADALLAGVALTESGVTLKSELEATLGATPDGRVAAAWEASAGHANVDTQAIETMAISFSRMTSAELLLPSPAETTQDQQWSSRMSAEVLLPSLGSNTHNLSAQPNAHGLSAQPNAHNLSAQPSMRLQWAEIYQQAVPQQAQQGQQGQQGQLAGNSNHPMLPAMRQESGVQQGLPMDHVALQSTDIAMQMAARVLGSTNGNWIVALEKLMRMTRHSQHNPQGNPGRSRQGQTSSLTTSQPKGNHSSLASLLAPVTSPLKKHGIPGSISRAASNSINASLGSGRDSGHERRQKQASAGVPSSPTRGPRSARGASVHKPSRLAASALQAAVDMEICRHLGGVAVDAAATDVTPMYAQQAMGGVSAAAGSAEDAFMAPSGAMFTVGVATPTQKKRGRKPKAVAAASAATAAVAGAGAARSGSLPAHTGSGAQTMPAAASASSMARTNKRKAAASFDSEAAAAMDAHHRGLGLAPLRTAGAGVDHPGRRVRARAGVNAASLEGRLSIEEQQAMLQGLATQQMLVVGPNAATAAMDPPIITFAEAAACRGMVWTGADAHDDNEDDPIIRRLQQFETAAFI